MKLMNMKRLGVLVLAGVLALSLAAPAFADDPNTTVVTSTYQAITLDVTVPATGAATINPYGLPVNLTHDETNGGETETIIDGTIVGEQITTGAPLMIVNKSTVALAVSAEVVGAPDGDGAVVLIEDASKVDAAETTGDDAGSVLKNVAAKFEAFAAPGFDGDEADWEVADKNEAFAELKSEDAALTAPVLEADTDGNGKTTTGSLVLREGDEDGLPQDGSAAFIRLSGKVAKNPTTAWAATDKFTATIAFSFDPDKYVAPVELKASVDSIAIGATSKITLATALPTVGQNQVTIKPDSIKWTSSKETYATVTNGTKAPTAPATTVAGTALTGTVTGVKNGSVVITVEFEGSDGITYSGSTTITITK